MGTMYGCQSCGESLFCAGAIVHHHDLSKLTGKSYSDGGSTCFLGALRGQVDGNGTSGSPTNSSTGEEQVVVTTRNTVTKKPLLAKLRLRPHSPSVTVGTGSHTGPSDDCSKRKSASPVLSKPSLDPEAEGQSGTSLSRCKFCNLLDAPPRKKTSERVRRRFLRTK